MNEFELCEECGIPLMISREQNWCDNGVISLTQNPGRRVVFYESAVLDGLFQGIGDLIGMPIEHVVIESRRRDVRKFIERLFSSQIDKMQLEGNAPLNREIFEERKQYNLQVNTMGRAYGYGDIQISDQWERGGRNPWRIQIIRNPYSLFLYAGEMLGSAEAFEQNELGVEYTEIGDNQYKLFAYDSVHPLELKERLKKRIYAFKDGTIDFERCASCGVPLEVARCRWDLEEGTIIDRHTRRRMAIFSPNAVEAVLDDLESEIGDSIPQTVIEAQRRHIRIAMINEGWRQDADVFRNMTALRGLGNITQFEGDRHHLKVTIENSCMHLLMVGTIQGLVELAYGFSSSNVTWNLSDDGDLEVMVKGERIMANKHQGAASRR